MITAAGKRRRSGASQYLQQQWGLHYTSATLANLAVRGEGPVYCLAGPYAVYGDDDLDEWARSRISGPMQKASQAQCGAKADCAASTSDHSPAEHRAATVDDMRSDISADVPERAA
jgi:hypothetical protein